jgi:hypothetical protein
MGALAPKLKIRTLSVTLFHHSFSPLPILLYTTVRSSPSYPFTGSVAFRNCLVLELELELK